MEQPAIVRAGGDNTDWSCCMIQMRIYLGHFLAIFLVSLSSKGYEDDYFQIGQEMQTLAKSHKLTFLHKKLGSTIDDHAINVFAVTAMRNSELYEDYEGDPAVFLNSLMHPRETISFSFLKQLVESVLSKSETNSYIRYVLENSVLLFMPYVNIDLFMFHQENKELADKALLNFRKNMNGANDIHSKCKNIWERGVDINRNFDYNFGTIQTSADQCSEEYRGEHAFSQAESKAIKEVFEFFTVKIAVDVHSYGNTWIYPFASEKNESEIMKSAVYQSYEYVFKVFEASSISYSNCFKKLDYVADGVYIDWAADKGALSFVLEIGQDFNQLSSESLTNKYVSSFIDLLMVMTSSAFEYFHNSVNQVCIYSRSLLEHSVTVKYQSISQQISNRLPPYRMICFRTPTPISKNEQTTISIDSSDIKLNMSISQMKLKPKGVKPQNKETVFLPSVEIISYLLIAIGVFCAVGLLCGLSVCWEKTIGSKAVDDQMLRLSDGSILNEGVHDTADQFEKIQEGHH